MSPGVFNYITDDCVIQPRRAEHYRPDSNENKPLIHLIIYTCLPCCVIMS